MRKTCVFGLICLCFFVFPLIVEAAEADVEVGDVRLGRAQGPGTEAVYFDDNSLIMDPEPTATPVYEFSNPQKRAWDLVVDTKNLIVRINTDRTRYEKTLRSKMDKQLFRLQQSIASMHTRALLYDRNKVEYVWEKEAVTALDVMDVAHMQTAEFHRDYREAERKHKEAERLLKNHRDIIQKPEEIEQKLEMNAKELYFAKKEVDRFTTLYNRFVEQFNHISKQKEEHIAKTLKEHFDLHRP